MFFYQISTLTAEVDTLETVGNATVKGLIGGGVDATWGVADTIAGGTAGSKMDLTAIVGDGTAGAAAGNVSTIGRSTSGIETFNITFKDASTAAGTLIVDTSSLAGAKNFNIVSATANATTGNDSVVFDGLAQDQMVTIKSAATQLGVELNYSEAAKAGKEDVASFSLHNAKALEVVVDGGMEAVKITATGDNEVGKINANGATKFELSGAGSLDAELTGGAGKIAEINASTATGSLDLTVTTAQLNTTKATIKGGTATDDVLNVNGEINTKMTVSGFETVGLDGREHDAAPSVTFDMSVVTGATTVANFDNDSALTVKNATGVTNLLMEGDGSAHVDTNMGIGAITFEAKTLQDKLDVAINNAGVALGMATATTEGVIKAGALDINNVKNITINAADADVELGGLIANKMESLTVTAAEDFSITGAVAFQKDATVNMAGVKGDVTMTTGALTTALDYTGSLAADHLILDTLTGGAGVAYDIKTGAGNDEVTLAGVGAYSAAKLNLNLGEGDDTLTVGGTAISTAEGKSQTIDFGTGTDTLIYKGSAVVDLSGSTVSGLTNIETNGTGGLVINTTTAKDLGVTYSGTATLTVQMDTTHTTYNANAANLTFKGADAADKFAIVGTNGVDNITAHTAGGTITGGKGADTITLGDGVDKVVFLATADNGKDSITGFTVGAATGHDVVHLFGDDTTVTTSAGAAAFAVSASTLASGAAAVGLAGGASSSTSDIIELTTELSNKGDLAAATDGTELLKALSSTDTAATGITAAANGDQCYFVAYQNGAAYLYHGAAGTGNSLIAANEITLVGVFANVAQDAFVAEDFTV